MDHIGHKLVKSYISYVLQWNAGCLGSFRPHIKWIYRGEPTLTGGQLRSQPCTPTPTGTPYHVHVGGETRSLLKSTGPLSATDPNPSVTLHPEDPGSSSFRGHPSRVPIDAQRPVTFRRRTLFRDHTPPCGPNVRLLHGGHPVVHHYRRRHLLWKIPFSIEPFFP